TWPTRKAESRSPGRLGCVSTRLRTVRSGRRCRSAPIRSCCTLRRIRAAAASHSSSRLCRKRTHGVVSPPPDLPRSSHPLPFVSERKTHVDSRNETSHPTRPAQRPQLFHAHHPAHLA